MIGTDTQIRYIQRDEIQHCNIFKNILIETAKENPKEFENSIPHIYELFKKAVEWEIKFSQAVIGSKILGMTDQSIEDYAFYLANKRLKDIKLDPIFPKRKNPYTHLELIAGVEDETSNRNNNFETSSISYKNASAIDGWDDL
jgi:ribonucleoside-diphosphate reductase beta chain